MEISIWLSFDDPFGVKENSFLIIGPFAFISPFCTLVRGGILFYHHLCDGELRGQAVLWLVKKRRIKRILEKDYPIGCSPSLTLNKTKAKKGNLSLESFRRSSFRPLSSSTRRKPLDEPVLDDCQCMRWQGRGRGNVHFF